jgi:hypothetical protein
MDKKGFYLYLFLSSDIFFVYVLLFIYNAPKRKAASDKGDRVVENHKVTREIEKERGRDRESERINGQFLC